jgi:hypothetical protein
VRILSLLFSKESHKGTTGVLLVDQIGLAIESSGNLDKVQSGLMSSIMKNAARLQQILSEESALPQ